MASFQNVRITTITLFVLLAQVAMSQKIGSMLHDTTEYGKTFELLFKEAVQARLENFDLALKLIDSSYMYVNGTGNMKRYLRCLSAKGSILYQNGRAHQAEEFITAALNMARHNGWLEVEKNVSSLLGACYLRQGEYLKSLPYFHMTLDYAIKINLNELKTQVVGASLLDGLQYGCHKGTRVSEIDKYTTDLLRAFRAYVDHNTRAVEKKYQSSVLGEELNSARS